MLPQAIFCAALIYHKTNQVDKAISLHKRIESIEPKFADNLMQTAVCYYQLGNTDEAVKYLKATLKIQPDYANAHRLLSDINRGELPSDILSSLMETFEHADGIDKIHAAFALGNRCETLKDYATAFQFYQIGNNLEFKRREVDVSQEFNFAQMNTKFFKASLRPGFAPIPVPSNGNRNLLIVGMPRSGTSLVEQILSAHSEVHGLGELNELRGFVKSEIIMYDDYNSNLDNVSARITQKYLDWTAKLSPPNKLVVDKMPANYAAIGYILLSNPDARVINLQRDPMAVALSNYKICFPAEELGWTFNLDTILANYGIYLSTMNYWKSVFPDRILDFSYEELTENQSEMTHKLLEFCGLDFEAACLNFHEQKRLVKTASAAQVSKKLYTGSSKSWQKYADYLGDYPAKFEAMREKYLGG